MKFIIFITKILLSIQALPQRNTWQVILYQFYFGPNSQLILILWTQCLCFSQAGGSLKNQICVLLASSVWCTFCVFLFQSPSYLFHYSYFPLLSFFLSCKWFYCLYIYTPPWIIKRLTNTYFLLLGSSLWTPTPFANC